MFRINQNWVGGLATHKPSFRAVVAFTNIRSNYRILRYIKIVNFLPSLVNELASLIES